jgi:hypothetical protein
LAVFSEKKKEDGLMDHDENCAYLPIFLSSETHYVYLFRQNLGTHVDIDVEEKLNELVWTIESVPLIRDEIEQLEVYNKMPPNSVFDNVFSFSKQPQSFKIVTKLSGDALVEEVKRIDHDTKLGGLVEVIIPRRKKLNKLSLKANRFAHLDTVVHSAQELLNRDEMNENL